VVAAILLLSACETGSTDVTGGSTPTTPTGPTESTGPTAATGPTGDAAALEGTWSGTWDTDIPQVHGTFSWTIEATANGFKGTIDIQDTSCVSNGQVDIALDGDTITIGSINAEQPITFTGTVSGDTMSGTYDASACPPPNTGSWEAVRSG
jgi:collagen type VII alpha